MSTVKVLVSGDPAGNLGALFRRVAAVNKSNGPFDYLFCVGPLFLPAGEALRLAPPCVVRGPSLVRHRRRRPVPDREWMQPSEDCAHSAACYEGQAAGLEVFWCSVLLGVTCEAC